MTLRVCFDSDAWQQYLYWESQDRKTLQRINTLIEACQRNAFTGIGKPEPLRRDLAGCWSRRINDTHRLVYRVVNRELQIVSCRYHYGER